MARWFIEAIAVSAPSLRTLACCEAIPGAAGGAWVVVNATEYSDLETVARAVLDAEREGQSFLLRTGPSFVRAIVEAPGAGLSSAEQIKTEAASARPHNIELDIDGASVWVWRGADPTMVTSIIAALKARK